MTNPKRNFDQFHPLDHWPGTDRCLSHYGGPIHHVKIAWRYKHRDNLQYFAYRYFLCKLGRHKMRKFWWPKDKVHGMMCHGCDKRVLLPWVPDPLSKLREERE